MYSLGHVGLAMESTVLIDIPGVFVTKSGDAGMRAVLKDCSYSKKHNFNLLSMSRLLHKQGWKIVRGDDTLIRIENGQGGTIRFRYCSAHQEGGNICMQVCPIC